MPAKQVSYTQGPGLKALRQALCPMRLGPHHERHEDGNSDAPGVEYRTPDGSVWVIPEALIRTTAKTDDLIVTGYANIGGHSSDVWSQGSMRPEKGGKLTYDRKPWFEGFVYPDLHRSNLEPDYIWERHFDRDGLTGALMSHVMRPVEVDLGSLRTEILPLRLYRQRRTVVLEMLACPHDGGHVLMIFDFRSNSKEIPVYNIELAES